jgi:hypothetical protein
VLYQCARDEYVAGRYLVEEREVALELAGLQLAIDHHPPSPTTMGTMTAIKIMSDEQALELVL